MKIYPIILSGGAGTRLWPLSREKHPKQFIRFLDGLDGSMLATTALRFSDNAAFEAPTILCNDDHRFLVRDELDGSRVTPRAIILEPLARNTAPAIAVAALSVAQDDPDGVLAVMPSDHIIKDKEAFCQAVETAARIPANDRLILFGVTPTAPNTGYGYIQAGNRLEGPYAGAYEVSAFHEKPDEATANTYLARDNTYWNSGIFVFPVATVLAEFERHAPDVLNAARNAFSNASEDLGFVRLDEVALAQSPAISIDYAVIEKTKHAALLPIDIGWSDVGSWSALWDLSERDTNGNATNKPEAHIGKDTEHCLIHAERGIVATLGLDNLVIVDTPDALLVADKARAQDVSGLVSELKTLNRPEYAQHIREHRPWGYFETLNVSPGFQVKRLHVKPGAKLSLQMHHHRSEHWVVVKGTARVTIAGSEQLVAENQSVYISATQWHRLENPGKVPLEIIEVQLGEYLGEDDIIRAEDDYNRDVLG